mmetsp:Transcript_27775/g.70132  ORF Transcript_27775/g.70132 Transcript_27775/m.70132 type:complete len:203 (-) Transcript_27775:2241-2849(-)
MFGEIFKSTLGKSVSFQRSPLADEPPICSSFFPAPSGEPGCNCCNAADDVEVVIVVVRCRCCNAAAVAAPDGDDAPARPARKRVSICGESSALLSCGIAKNWLSILENKDGPRVVVLFLPDESGAAAAVVDAASSSPRIGVAVVLVACGCGEAAADSCAGGGCCTSIASCPPTDPSFDDSATCSDPSFDTAYRVPSFDSAPP